MLKEKLPLQTMDEEFELKPQADHLLFWRRDHAHTLMKTLAEDARNGQVGQASTRRGRATYAVVPYSGGQALLRDYWHGGLFRFFTRDRILRRRVRHEIRVTEALRQHGVSVPLVLGAIVRPLFWPFCRATLITREIEGAVDLAQYLQEESTLETSIREKRLIIEQCGKQIRHLHDTGVQHRDLNLKNIVVQRGNKAQTHLIDFDKARVRPKLRIRARISNILRLKRSLDKLKREAQLVLTQADELRFLQAYGAPDRDFLRRFWRAYRSYQRNLPLRKLWWRIVYG